MYTLSEEGVTIELDYSQAQQNREVARFPNLVVDSTVTSMVTLGMTENSRYHEEPLLNDVKDVVKRWLPLSVGTRIDLCDTDQEQYTIEKPFVAVIRAAGFLTEQGEFKLMKTKKHSMQAGLRFPGVHVYTRVGTRQMGHLPWFSLGGPCPKCGVEFLFYGLNGRPRMYCTPKCAAAAKTKRARGRKIGPVEDLTPTQGCGTLGIDAQSRN